MLVSSAEPRIMTILLQFFVALLCSGLIKDFTVVFKSMSGHETISYYWLTLHSTEMLLVVLEHGWSQTHKDSLVFSSEDPRDLDYWRSTNLQLSTDKYWAYSGVFTERRPWAGSYFGPRTNKRWPFFTVPLYTRANAMKTSFGSSSSSSSSAFESFRVKVSIWAEKEKRWDQVTALLNLLFWGFHGDQHEV